MTNAWLEDDGRRTCMNRVDGFAVQVWVRDDGYNAAGVFLLGEPSSSHHRIVGVTLDLEDDFSIQWLSGTSTALGVVAPAFVHALRKAKGVHLHWRNNQHQTIQEAVFAVASDQSMIGLSDRRVAGIGKGLHGQGHWNGDRHSDSQRRAGSRR